MKICHVFPFFSIKYAGGTSDLMYKICKAQEKLGHQPIISTGDYQLDQELGKGLPGTKIFAVKSYFDQEGFSIMPGLIKFAKLHLKSIDIVHMHAYRTFQNLILYYYCRKYHIPYVIDAHGAVPYFRRKHFLKWLFDKLVGIRMLRHAACLIAETQVGVQEYMQLDPVLDINKIQILSPPFDTEEFKSLPNKGVFSSVHGLQDKKIIMFLGRLHYIKGIDFLINGFYKLLQKRQDICLVLVGPDNGHMKELQLLVQSLNINDYVIFAGFLFGKEKLSALVDADVVVQTSRHEQGAWAPFEAVLCGTPIIVTAHTGAGEDVKKIDAGYLVEFGNEEQLAGQIDWVLENRRSAKKKAMVAKRHIENHLSMNQRAEEYINLYRSCGKG